MSSSASVSKQPIRHHWVELPITTPRDTWPTDRSMHFQHFSVFRSDMVNIKTFMRMSASKEQFWPLWGWHCTGRGQLRLGW